MSTRQLARIAASTVGLLLAVGTAANAQVTSGDATCRGAIQKSARKLGAAAMKTIDGCVKDVLGGKHPPTTHCNNWTIADSSKGKIAGKADKLRAGMSSACSLVPANFAGAQCPSPADGSDGVDGVSSVAELADCEVDINTLGIQPLRKYILNPDYARILAHPNAGNIAKCANAIGKNATKLWSTVAKERGKCQATSDKSAGPYGYGPGDSNCYAADPSAKIAAAVTKLQDGIQKACGDTLLTSTELGLIGTCGSTVAGIKSCVADAVKKNANGATATAYEFAGVCPSEVKLVVNGGAAGGQVLTRTSWDLGWTGLGHDMDFVDGFAARVNLGCNADCSSCSVTANCAEGNCRCSNNPSTICSTPFAAGGVCGAGTCVVHFGPPLARSAGSAATCTTNIIESELIGTADAGTGASSTLVKLTSKVHLGISLIKPCPTCTGATIGAAGVCSGGQRNGLACTTNAIDTTFGNVSYDCPPTTAANITGSGLKINLQLTDGTVTLPFADACDFPLGASACACGACTLDNSVGCVNDVECSSQGLGTCTNAGGEPRQPNACDNLSCVADPAAGPGEGTCGSMLAPGPGPTDTFCSGAVRATGEGYVPCLSNANCTPAVGGGTCSLSKQRDCYLGSGITATGIAGTDGAELVAVACSGTTTSAGVNAAYGMPGATRVRLDMDFTGYCPDGTTPYELGGANCP